MFQPVPLNVLVMIFLVALIVFGLRQFPKV
jgi:hypothetical protein